MVESGRLRADVAAEDRNDPAGRHSTRRIACAIGYSARSEEWLQKLRHEGVVLGALSLIAALDRPGCHRQVREIRLAGYVYIATRIYRNPAPSDRRFVRN